MSLTLNEYLTIRNSLLRIEELLERLDRRFESIVGENHKLDKRPPDAS